MIRFLGNIEAKTDTKGRVFIPAGFRKQLQAASEERLVLRKDVFQDCLILYPESVWFKTQNQLRQRLNKWNAKHQQIFRQFVSDAEIMIPDGNGRILLPKRYLQMAGIQSEVRFIGVDNTIGENDSLSAIVAAAIGADLLILLSDIAGLYDSDPHRNPDARLIETVPVIDAHILSLAGDKGSALATGGMVTKLHAAQIATSAGCEMVIANGEKPEVLYDIVAGRRAGTRFLIPHS